MLTSWIFFLLSFGSAAAESKGDVCFASTWEAKTKSLFGEVSNWFDNKIPKANDIVILSGGDVRVTKKAIGGHFELNSGMINIDGGGLFVNGGLSCVGEECDSKKNTDYKLLFDRSKRKTCPLPKTTKPKTTKPTTTTPKPTKPTTTTVPTTTKTTTTSTSSTSTSSTSTSTTSTSTPSWKRTSATIKPWRACDRAEYISKTKKLAIKSFELKNGAAVGKGFGTEWISFQTPKFCNLASSGTAAITIPTVEGTTYEVEFDSSVWAHDLDGFKNDFSTGLVVVDDRVKRPYYFHTSATFNPKTQKWQRIKMHFVASKAKTTLKFSEDPKNCIFVRDVQVSACKALSSGCSKTCQGQTCDYWGAEEAYTCAILEADYGCNCAGCKCAVDEMVCQKDKCLGKSCDVWVAAGISCETLKVSQGCTCTACKCGKGVRDTTTTTTSTTTSTDVVRTTTTTTSTSTTSTTVPGCTNKKACNYNPEASGDDGSCQMPKEFHDCKDKCLVKLDVCGVCGGKGAGADKSKCSAKQFVGDDYCDDGNNNCQCGWDEGDCCGDKNNYNYCKKCKCVDPSYSAPAPSVCKKPCGKKQWKGDNNCDDNNNICGCDWDGGDCCGVKKNYQYCKKCKCLDPKFTAPAPSSDGCSDSCKKACAKPSYKGDGYCDDDNNHCGCDWDAGDCCGDKNYNYCSKCKCLDCKYEGKTDKCTSDIKGVCKKPGWKGDNNCDDMNNNAGCDWDGGDCCGDKNYNYCSKCECLDCTFKGKGDKCISVSKGGCGAKNYKGDKFCDDSNNNAACDWDGGDCCGTSNNYKYCKKCACRDCEYEAPTDKCTDKIKGSCKKPKWKGDKNCDDENNNAGCNWDGGDCCGPNNNYGYCSKCLCLDCTYKGKGDGCVDVVQKGCGAPNFKGDGFCDDKNNVAGCSWDGGDCCGAKRNIKYCKICKCLDCKAGGDGCVTSIKGGCAKPVWKGDQNCDDVNNNAGCGWDGGDCCGKANNYDYCKTCKCLDCKHEPCKGNKVCKKPVWKGDGNCDDENNVCGCNWDGGDCCGPKVKKPYCKECKCLDPLLKDLKCNGTCKKPKLSSDAFCDDENNNCGCSWDGGACCGAKAKKDYCSQCKCLDPKA